ncbi:MAG: hypothetical protein J6J58_01465 [Oscillospiraceae bacterium]|nr:hypothetical protein [Oscillospiraceae bacterium]
MKKIFVITTILAAAVMMTACSAQTNIADEQSKVHYEMSGCEYTEETCPVPVKDCSAEEIKEYISQMEKSGQGTAHAQKNAPQTKAKVQADKPAGKTDGAGKDILQESSGADLFTPTATSAPDVPCPICASTAHSVHPLENGIAHYHGNGTDQGLCPVPGCGLGYSPDLKIDGPSKENDLSCFFNYHGSKAMDICPVCGAKWCLECGSLYHYTADCPDKVVVAPVPTCPDCGSTEHTSHPVCGAVGHSADGVCGVCGSSYTTPVCGAVGHSADGVCGVCGSSYTTSAPTCPTCGAADHTVHPQETVAHYHGNGSDEGFCPVPGCGLHYSPDLKIDGPGTDDDFSDFFNQFG